MNTAKILAGVFGAGLAASLAANALMYQRYSSSRPVLTMETGGSVSRKEYRDALDYHYGKPVLKKIVFTRLVGDAAKKAGLTPTDADVEERLREVERMRPSEVQAARRDPVKLEEMKKDIHTDIALERLRAKDVEATDKDALAFYQSNKQFFVIPAQVETVSVFSSNAVDASTAEELLKQNMAPDVIARQPRLHVLGVGGFIPDLRSLPPSKVMEMQQAMMKAGTGSVKTLDLGGAYLSFRVKKKGKGLSVQPFEQAKKRALLMAKLQKAPTAEATLAKLYHRAGVVFEMNQYAGYFSDLPKVGDAAPRQTASAR